MSDIQEEQKRLYKRAIKKDLERNYEQNLFVGRAIKLEEENKELQDRINKAYKILDGITFFTTPIGQVMHLGMIISDIRKVKSILKGKE